MLLARQARLSGQVASYPARVAALRSLALIREAGGRDHRLTLLRLVLPHPRRGFPILGDLEEAA